MTLSAFTTAFLSPTGALLMAELSAGLFFIMVLILIFAARAHSQRLRAARLLLNERTNLAKAATDTFAAHCAVLIPDHPLSEEAKTDYHERSHALIGEWVQPWLEPSADGMIHAVREVMTVRHNDLHHFAALLRNSQKSSVPTEEIQQLHDDLAMSRKAESERSAQLAEALRSVGIIVGEYGRKFGIDADLQVPKILRALIYLQALDQGKSTETAKEIADDSLSNLVLIDESDAPPPQQAASVIAPEIEQSEKSFTESPSSPESSATPQKPPEPLAPATAAATESQPIEEPSIDDILASIQAEAPPAVPTALPVAAQPATAPAAERPNHELPAPDAEGMINLDDIDIPERPNKDEAGDHLNFDDIDALLDAEINRQISNKAPSTATKLPSLDDDEFDLSKKP